MLKLLAHALIKNSRSLFVKLNPCEVGAVAVGVLKPVLLDEGIMHVNPTPIPFESPTPNRQVILAFARDSVVEQVFDFRPVVGVNIFSRLVLFALDEFFGAAFHHLGEFPRTPYREMLPVRRHAHKDGIVVQRRENLFVEARLEIQH